MREPNLKARAEVVKSMEIMVRCINDESIIDSWLMVGVADGDIDENTTLEEIIENGYCDDTTYQELMSTFLKCMYRASADGLYSDGITSASRCIEWR